MCTGCIDNRYTCVFDHSRGIRWIDLKGDEGKVITGVHLSNKYNMSCGLVAVNNKILAIEPGGYKLIAAMEEDYDKKDIIKHDGTIIGKPTVFGNILCVSNRVTAQIEIIDISEIEKPNLIQSFTSTGSPAELVIKNASVIIPDGYKGLQIIDNFV